MYGVETRTLLQAVKRNLSRFPADFQFQLTIVEWPNLRSQSVISSSRHGCRRYPPFAFTEQGIAMLSSVLLSEQAVAVNIEIMREFVRMRGHLAANSQLAKQLRLLKARVARKFADHDDAIAAILSAIRELIAPAPTKRRGIGFLADIKDP
jgi:hypothetical protein